MRITLAILVALSTPATAVSAHPEEDFERLTGRLQEHPPHLSAARLPPGYKIGRCLFEVRGKRLISGKCAYTIGKDGEFQIDGSRQVYSGIDYPRPDCYCAEISTDHFVQVDHELLDGGGMGPGWWAHWNVDKRATHAEWLLGPVTRARDCYSNKDTKICLWKQ
jgi:hypothetical protein